MRASLVFTPPSLSTQQPPQLVPLSRPHRPPYPYRLHAPPLVQWLRRLGHHHQLLPIYPISSYFSFTFLALGLFDLNYDIGRSYGFSILFSLIFGVVAVLNHHLDEYTESSDDVEYWVSSGLQRIRDHETCDAATEEIGIKELLPAYLDPFIQDADLPTGVSFASGGSGYDPQTPQLVSVLSLSSQLESFKEYIGKLKRIVGDEKTNYIITNTLYLVVAGSDDIANTYFALSIGRYEYDINTYSALVVSHAANFVQELYKLGARRIGVFGTPPLGCMPSQRTLAGGGLRICADDYNQASQLYNSKLSYQLRSLGSSLPQSKVVYIDIYSPLLDIIQNPKNYGLEVVDRGCCGSGSLEVAVLCNRYMSSTCSDDSKYLFWDSYHPTEKGYKVLTDEILMKYVNDFF